MAITAAIGVGVNIIMGLLLYCGGHGHSHLGGGHNHSHPPTERTSLLRSASGTSNGYAPIEEDAEHNSDEKRGPEVNINVRAAFVHVLGDLLQSCGVLVAALIILWKPQWGIVDPICTLIFSVIVMCTTFYIIRDALVVLLEGRPSSIDFSIVFKSLESIEGVKKVHNLRIWALTMNKIALSVHLEIDPDTDAQAVLKATSLMLKQKFGVHESTIQIEDFQADSAECNECQPPVA
ncbi:UNVERIFIED_CONTAM: Zinc transporter 2, partial [Eudyptes robustus]